MIKWIKIFITFWITSFFLFPVIFTFYEGMNTKTFMAAVGLVFAAYSFLMNKERSVPQNLFPLAILAVAVSLVGVLSMALNNTNDDAYSGYVTSMAVWLSAAYVVCCCIKYTHGRISIELLCDYLIAVCVMQCISALLIDNVPEVQRVFDAYVRIDQKTLHEINRLYGFGANLDVAGIKFSATLIMLACMVRIKKDYMSTWLFVYYVLAFAIISVVGSMIARTTYVGIVLSVAYFVITTGPTVTISTKTVGKLALLLLLVAALTLLCVVLYNTESAFRHWLRFAFEGFFNLIERGHYSIDSTGTLKTMYVFPDNPKTWIIGDGYFSNPYWSDPTYTYIDQNIRGFYKETDVGYLRFIFYFGVIGLFAFSTFMCKAAQTCIDKCPKYTSLFLFILLANFVTWFKVATDLFLVFALFICTVNMMPEDSEDPEAIDP